jgi:hypothetical protein
MNLEGGLGFIHQMTVELPTGERRVINTDEGTVQQLIAVMAGVDVPYEEEGLVKASPMPARSMGMLTPREEPVYDPDLAPAPDPEAWESEEGAAVFGGDADLGEMGSLADMPPALPQAQAPQVGGIGHAPQPVVQQQLQVVNPPRVLPNGKIVPPTAKTVPKDEMGYPIVPKRPAVAGGIGQSAALSEDEDGTQI